MTARVALLLSILGLAVAGCLSDDDKLTAVSSRSFDKPGRTRTASFKQAPPATEAVALRVAHVGKKIVADNKRCIKQKIAFMTIGRPEEEIFHQNQKDVSTIWVTEGLAKQCKSDGQLAAVLSEELGKVVAEQMAKARPLPSRMPPMPIMTPHVGNSIGDDTFTDKMILAHFEEERQRQEQRLPVPPPPPETLARLYLQSAGFNAKDLETVKPLLRKAEQNSSLELSIAGKQGG